MATHSSPHNNVDHPPPPHPAEHKRVSFGGEEQVQMIVYDDGLADDYSIGQQNKQWTASSRQSFTEPDAPPSKVKVHAEQAEIPRPISPPAQIAPLGEPSSAFAGGRLPFSNSNSALAGQQQQSTAAAHPPPLMTMNSPPLPAFVKRMEHDSENPFRPDEQLYHEVDPIVEMYRQRPFPPSPSHGSPIPPHQHTTAASSTMTSTPPSRHGGRQDVVANGGGGGGGGGVRHSSLAEGRRETGPMDGGGGRPLSPSSQQLQQSPLIQQQDGLPGPPSKAEVVRLEKKKRACCSLQ